MTHMRWGMAASVLVFGLVGCVESKPTDVQLVVSLASESVMAGDPVGWTAHLDRGGDTTSAVAVEWRSDLEDGLAFSGLDLFPRTAGPHHLIGQASVDGELLEASVELSVEPAPAHTLDFQLSAASVRVGEPVGYTASAFDGFGNAVDIGRMTLTHRPELVLTDGQLSSVVAGEWLVTAELDDLEVSVPFETLPGPPHAIALGVQVFGDTVATSVDIRDEHDNPVHIPSNLVVEGVEHAVIGPVIYFLGEGRAWISAEEPVSGLVSESVSVDVDWSPPALAIDSPARGSWHSVGTTTFSGTAVDSVADGVTVEVDGTPVAVMDGAWERDIDLDFGMTVVETIATDAIGLRSRDLRAVVAGNLRGLGEVEDAGMLVRLEEDDAGLGVVERMSENDLEGVDLAEELSNPVYDERERTCRTQFGVTVCVTTEVAIDVNQVGYSAIDVQLDGQASGLLTGHVVMSDFTVDWTADGKLSDSPVVDSGRGTASELLMDMELEFAVDDGVVDVTATNVEIELVDFDLGASADITAVGRGLGVDLDDIIASVVELAAADAFPPVVENAVEDALLDLNIDIGWPEGSRLVAQPLDVEVDARGLVMPFGTVTTLETWRLDSPEHGALIQPYSVPAWASTDPAAMALSLNMLNQIFHANWGAGFIELEGGPELFQVEPAIVSAALPGVHELVGTLRATYPPFFVPDGAGKLRMELPELRIDFYNYEAIEDTAVYTIYLTVSTPVEFGLRGNRLDLLWGEQDVWMDVEVAPADADLYFLESLLETFSAGLVLNEYELVDALPLPTVGGYRFQGEAVTVFGPDDAYVVVDGGFDVE